MIQIHTFKQLFIRFLLFPILSPAQATVVRIDFSNGDQAADPVYVELFDLDTPVTIDPLALDAEIQGNKVTLHSRHSSL